MKETCFGMFWVWFLMREGYTLAFLWIQLVVAAGATWVAVRKIFTCSTRI